MVDDERRAGVHDGVDTANRIQVAGVEDAGLVYRVVEHDGVVGGGPESRGQDVSAFGSHPSVVRRARIIRVVEDLEDRVEPVVHDAEVEELGVAVRGAPAVKRSATDDALDMD